MFSSVFGALHEAADIKAPWEIIDVHFTSGFGDSYSKKELRTFSIIKNVENYKVYA